VGVYNTSMQPLQRPQARLQLARDAASVYAQAWALLPPKYHALFQGGTLTVSSDARVSLAVLHRQYSRADLGALGVANAAELLDLYGDTRAFELRLGPPPGDGDGLVLTAIYEFPTDAV
jgi:hypothetical protein